MTFTIIERKLKGQLESHGRKQSSEASEASGGGATEGKPTEFVFWDF